MGELVLIKKGVTGKFASGTLSNSQIGSTLPPRNTVVTGLGFTPKRVFICSSSLSSSYCAFSYADVENGIFLSKNGSKNSTLTMISAQSDGFTHLSAQGGTTTDYYLHGGAYWMAEG